MIFKKKYVRSEWYKGLLECEQEYKSGGRLVKLEDGVVTEWLWISYGKYGRLGINVNQHYQKAKGYLDYIDYFQEILNK